MIKQQSRNTKPTKRCKREVAKLKKSCRFQPWKLIDFMERVKGYNGFRVVNGPWMDKTENDERMFDTSVEIHIADAYYPVYWLGKQKRFVIEA